MNLFQLEALRQLKQGASNNDTGAPLANNYRRTQKLHHRPVRTNIDFNYKVILKFYRNNY